MALQQHLLVNEVLEPVMQEGSEDESGLMEECGEYEDLHNYDLDKVPISDDTEL